jgi:O-antigen ligase
MSKVLILLAALALASLLGALFARWERLGKAHHVVIGLIALLILEAGLYDNQDNEPRSIFHPGTGTLQFRLPEVIIVVALIARLVARRRPLTIGVPALLWVAFGAWMTVELIEGLIRHNNSVQIPYEGKAIIYVVGGYALASGVDLRRLLETRAFERLMLWSAAFALILDPLALAKKSYSVHLPLLPLPNFGAIGADAATLFVTIGLIGVILEMAKERRRWLPFVAAVPLLLSAFLASQRAALVGLGASVCVVLFVALGPTARRRLRITSGEVALGLLAVFGVVLVFSLVPAATSQRPIQIPLTSKFAGTFNTTGKAESAQDRLNQWSNAWADIKQSPVLGRGLGFQYSYYSPGPRTIVVTDLTHNIGLDLLLRTGLIGLGLFVVAMGSSLVEGLAVWRLHPDRMIGVLALALVAVVVGFVAKGMVESIFEKYRLATMLGLTLGLLRSAVTSMNMPVIRRRAQLTGV